ncbi:NAD(P)-dependent oxidoreductase [Evansella halocellulosilytica]|uniref:NAD(P)-dependent oxidoreductase n=1 Tax=Evansella halocellulosilytica TaxID=2011013 RepID=UPI000BB97C5E|nr:NAD(P)-binding domain-containing protein [Evansella halocellulosilytica]
MNNKVTVIGLGPMGQALASAFMKKGYDTNVWNRTIKKADSLKRQGAAVANTAAKAISASPLVIICVLNYDAAEQILHSAADKLSGKTVVNLTADSPERARSMSEWVQEQGATYLDGAIMSPTPTIGTDEAVVLYSGPEEVFTDHEQTLKNLGGTPAYLGSDYGRAAAFDVALLDFFWTSMSGYVHSLAIAGKENISAREFAPFAQGIVDILPNILVGLAQEVDEEKYSQDDSSLISNVASMNHIIEVSESHRIDASVLHSAKAWAQRAIDQGYGKESFARVTDILKRSSI